MKGEKMKKFWTYLIALIIAFIITILLTPVLYALRLPYFLVGWFSCMIFYLSQQGLLKLLSKN